MIKFDCVFLKAEKNNIIILKTNERLELPSTSICDNKKKNGMTLAWDAILTFESGESVQGFLFRQLEENQQMFNNEIKFIYNESKQPAEGDIVTIELTNKNLIPAMDISIGGIVFGEYHKYLERWVKSICNLEIYPKEVVILADSKASRIFKNNCRHLFEEKNIPYMLIIEDEIFSLGKYRNLVVAEIESEWVLMLDIDDEILPHAIGEYQKLSATSDVICSSIITGGRVTKFLSTTQERVLQLPRFRPCCHLSPYRKHFWLKQPYIELIEHIWDDSALWIGFAHNGASRWTSTNTAVVKYNKEKTGHFTKLGGSGRKIAKEQLTKYIRDRNNFKNTQL